MDPENRCIRLALALGPGSIREAFTELEPTATVLKRFWPRRSLYPAWQEAKSARDLVRRMRVLLNQYHRRGARVILAGDPDYPSPLIQRGQSPSVLYVWGRIPTGHLVAIVGSRGAMVQGTQAAHRLAQELAEANIGTVSGGAIGIDTAAHQGTLQGRGRTLAVLGSGLDRLYPERNTDLFHRIANQGAVVTPYPLGTPPRPWHFPQRNRLIAAWAKVVVVVEAQRRSGALSTARCAKTLGVPVLALPSSPGTLSLLRHGAGGVSSAQDVLNVLAGSSPRPFSPTPGDLDQQQVWALLSKEPMAVDEIAIELHWKASRAAAALIRLELARLARPLAGGRYGVERS